MSAQAASPVTPAGLAPTIALRIAAQYPVGKWPEGVDLAGNEAWVADSGDRRLTRVDLASGATTTVKVGRLPTDVTPLPDGARLVLVQTDKVVVRVPPGPKAKSKPVARLPDCPTAMAADADAAYVLLWKDCSSVDSSVVRVEPASGAQKRSAALGADAFDLSAAGGRVYVIHRDGRLSILDARTLAAVMPAPVVGVQSTVLATEAAVFVDGAGRVARVDPKSGLVTHTAAQDHRVLLLGHSGDELFVAVDAGEIRVYAAADLSLRRILKLPDGTPEIRGLAFRGADLVVTTYSSADAMDDAPGKPAGRVLVLSASAGSGPP